MWDGRARSGSHDLERRAKVLGVIGLHLPAPPSRTPIKLRSASAATPAEPQW